MRVQACLRGLVFASSFNDDWLDLQLLSVVAARFNSFRWTFNLKDVGSNPTRPIGDLQEFLQRGQQTRVRMRVRTCVWVRPGTACLCSLQLVQGYFEFPDRPDCDFGRSLDVPSSVTARPKAAD